MGVNILGKFLNREPQEGINYLSLTLTSDQILANIWRLGDNSEVNIVGHSEKQFHTVDSLIHEAAVAIDTAAKSIRTDVSQVVFGLSSYWFENGSISKETHEILKNLAEELELDAQAFVPLSASIVHFFKLKGTETDTLIIGSFKDYTEVSWVSRGSSETKEYKGKAGKEEIKDLIHQFPTAQEVQPGLVVLFGESASHLKHELSKDHKFFSQQSKIEILTNEDLGSCIVYSQAADVLGREPHLVLNPTTMAHPQTGTQTSEQKMPESEPSDQQFESEPESADTQLPPQPAGNGFEFKEGEDVLKSPESELLESTIPQQEHKNGEEYAVNVDTATPAYESPGEKLQAASAHKKKSVLETLTTLNWLTAIVHGSKRKLLLPALILFILIIGSVYVLGYTITSAEVLVKSNSKPLEGDFDVTVASGAAIDTARSRIPGEETSAVVSESADAKATGTKKTGNNAKGEVTVFNWTTSKVSFDKGSVIISRNGVKFNLDNGIEVASRSASSPGEAKVNVSAADFGSNGNVAAGSEFTFQKHDELLYSAKNDTAFSGGDEKEITVVTKEDQNNLSQTLEENLMQKAREELQQKVGGQNISEESIELRVIQKQFSASPDQEATNFTLNMQVEASALTYKEEVLKELLAQTAQEENDDNLQSKPENLDILDISPKRGKGTLNLEGRYRANLVPKIDEDNLRIQIAGKGQKEAKEIIKQNPEISDVEFKLSPNFIIFSSLPKNKDKIKIKIEAIK